MGARHRLVLYPTLGVYRTCDRQTHHQPERRARYHRRRIVRRSSKQRLDVRGNSKTGGSQWRRSRQLQEDRGVQPSRERTWKHGWKPTCGAREDRSSVGRSTVSGRWERRRNCVESTIGSRRSRRHGSRQSRQVASHGAWRAGSAVYGARRTASCGGRRTVARKGPARLRARNAKKMRAFSRHCSRWNYKRPTDTCLQSVLERMTRSRIATTS